MTSSKSSIREIFLTSFCNHGHDVNTGRPIDHERYVLPPAALRAERDGDVEKAIRIFEVERNELDIVTKLDIASEKHAAKKRRRVVKGSS